MGGRTALEPQRLARIGTRHVAHYGNQVPALGHLKLGHGEVVLIVEIHCSLEDTIHYQRAVFHSVSSIARDMGQFNKFLAKLAIQGYNGSYGAWRSLVARSVRDAEVGGSSPLAPILAQLHGISIYYTGFMDQ